MNNSDSLRFQLKSRAPRANEETLGNEADDTFDMPETPVSQEDIRTFFPYMEFEMPPFEYEPSQTIGEDSVDVDARSEKKRKTKTNVDSEVGLRNSDTDTDQNSQERMLGSNTGSITNAIPAHPYQLVSCEQRHGVDAQDSAINDESVYATNDADGGLPVPPSPRMLFKRLKQAPTLPTLYDSYFSH
ncbi:hypothetical protein L218DRAFT_947428 [Marasmius fiardii PR-910]|nr:hypothetical protein L218DRAFT_947428 [Marasmius fiardii PR-910]